MANGRTRKTLAVLGLAIVALAAGYAWYAVRPPGLPSGIAMGNGRIEATEVDVASKLPGHLSEVRVQEGDLVERDQVVARMDTLELEAQLKQAQAQVLQATQDARQTEAQVAQAREALRRAQAGVAQRRSEQALARSDLARAEELAAKGFYSNERLDQARTSVQTATAALSAAGAGVPEAEASIDAAKARVTAAQAAIALTKARAEQVQVTLDESTLRTPIAGRVLYRLVEPGTVLPAGGKVVTVLDLTDVYMTIYLPTEQAGQVRVGSDARIVLDARPEYVIPAKVSFVAPRSQFTPREVETRTEREKLMFRIKVRIAPDLLRRYQERVKTGLPGVAYVQTDSQAAWPVRLQVKLPQ